MKTDCIICIQRVCQRFVTFEVLFSPTWYSLSSVLLLSLYCYSISVHDGGRVWSKLCMLMLKTRVRGTYVRGSYTALTPWIQRIRVRTSKRAYAMIAIYPPPTNRMSSDSWLLWRRYLSIQQRLMNIRWEIYRYFATTCTAHNQENHDPFQRSAHSHELY